MNVDPTPLMYQAELIRADLQRLRTEKAQRELTITVIKDSLGHECTELARIDDAIKALEQRKKRLDVIWAHQTRKEAIASLKPSAFGGVPA